MSNAKRVGGFTVELVSSIAADFASRFLDPYCDEILAEDRTFARKEINDSLWGTISLSPLEVAIIDSPLIQRLRSIRQLGVVHWVYPGATHTRFDHTLGVLHQVQNLASAVNTLASQRGKPDPIKSHHVRLLRLCALLHDVGHAAFSHVSEKAIQSLPAVNPLAAEFSRIHRIGTSAERQAERADKVETKQLSEIFAFYIVKSKAMTRFLELLRGRTGEVYSFTSHKNEKIEDVVDLIGKAIIGVKIDDRLPLLHQFISGPFDADKLDYFVRDAHQAGTPSVLDISRLVQKISFRELDASELPDDIAGHVAKIEDKYCLFGMRWSGVPVLDELHLARVLLYAKIYRHTKVIAIEQMIKSALFCLSEIVSPEDIFRFVYRYDDEALLAFETNSLTSAIGLNRESLTPESIERLDEAVKIFKDVKRRKLVVKAFQLQLRFPADPRDKDNVQRDGLAEFNEDIEHPQKGLEFRERLLDEMDVVISLLNQGSKPSRIALSASVMIHTQSQTPGGSQIQRAFLLPADGPPMSFREYTVNRQVWASSYMSDQPAGFIFTTDKYANFAYIAVEKLLRESYGVILPDSALELSKRDRSKIEEIKFTLMRGGYYRNSPHDLRPTPERMRKVDIANAIDRFVVKRSIYQEPQDVESRAYGSGLTGKERTHGWLRQFESDEHIECAVKVLDSFKILTRSDTTNALKNFISENPEFNKAWVVPFGEAKDSGAIQSYYSADLQGTLISGCKVLNDIGQLRDDDAIIFIDDFIGSGGQATDILAAGFGISSLRKPLGEHRDLFEHHIQERLRNSSVGFVFTAGWDSGLAEMTETVGSIGLSAKIYRYLAEDSLPFADKELKSEFDDEVISSFFEKCRSIGKDLILEDIKRQDLKRGTRTKIAARNKKSDDRALGYGNRAMLLGTPFNVPTQSLTAIWAYGEVDGIPWMPLMRRRKKD
ncbi:phosphoribosyltransferase-like protein [Methylorubrum rhodinum]|uniref:phosphoribosyltransferase-like protein n=1 Tax=Methylorubrum rhodinum TaxID=29428 RepID=UPI001616420D|nr:HD domain-containing protein [Methylorubrum rhodinum]